MDAGWDKNYIFAVLGYNASADEVTPLRTNSAGDAVLVEALLMVNDYKVAVTGADTTPAYLSSKIVDSATVTWTVNNPGANETYTANIVPGAGEFYQIFQSDGISETQRGKANFSLLFALTDNVGNDSTDIDIDTAVLGDDPTLISTLTANTTFLTNIANSTVFVDALIANTTFTTNLANDTNFINSLIANSTFITDLSNDPMFLSNITTNISGSVSVVADGVTITGDGTAGDPLVAVSSSSNPLTVNVNQTAHGFSVGDVIYPNGANTYDFALATIVGLQSNKVGVVTIVTDANNFIYSVIVPEFSTSITGAEGSIIWLSDTVPGGMTITRPNVAVPLGTLLASGSKMQFNPNSNNTVGAQATPTTYFIPLQDSEVASPIQYVSSIGDGNFNAGSINYKLSSFGLTTTTAPSKYACFDVLNNTYYGMSISNGGGGNFTFNVTQYDITGTTTGIAWSVAGFAVTTLPIEQPCFVDIVNNKLYFIGSGVGVTIDGTPITSGVYYTADLQAGGGTISTIIALVSGSFASDNVVVNPGTQKIFSLDSLPTFATFTSTTISSYTAVTGYTVPTTNLTTKSNIIDGYLYLVSPNSCVGNSSGSQTSQTYLLVNQVAGTQGLFLI